jgi:hypothetical protein
MPSCFYNVLDRLLGIELSTIACRLGFSDKQPDKPSFDDVCEAVKALNQLSLCGTEDDRNMFITIAALLWEYAHDEYPNLRDVLIHLLSRIGYAPSSIILDPSYADDNKYEPLRSFISQIATTLNQRKYEVKIGNHSEMLTAFQLSVSNSIRENRVVGISAPTSAGKSYVLLMEAARTVVENRWDVIYIVPTISLINQVTADFNKYFKKLNASNVEIFNSFNPELVNSDTSHIFILTQERAAAAFTMREKPFQRKSFLIVDEIQNIERISSGDSEMRSKVLLDTIYEFRFSENIEKIVVSGARITQIDTLCNELLGDDCIDNSTNISPVLNLTYSIAKVKNQYFLKQYCSLLDKPKTIVVENPSLIKGHGKKLYNDSYLSYLTSFVTNLGDDSQNIIFAPNPATARKTAISLADGKNNNNSLSSLVKYLQDTVRDNYALADIVAKGFAYHHGKLPQHVRKVVEYAITQKLISNVVCTTTLMQGVNLPAQNVVIRNPHLYVKSGDGVQELSSYEMANLRGRAGRLLKDFIGRSFVLDENEFLKVTDEYQQETLFEDTYKELDSSYGGIYSKHVTEISTAVADGTPSTKLPKEYAFIVTHIRQTVLRHNADAKERLNRIGIAISDKEYDAYAKSLSTLIVPRDICLANRYSDPEILNMLYTDHLNDSLPDLPTDTQKGAENKLSNVLKYLRDNDNYSTLFKERVPKHYSDGSQRSILCGMAIKWAKQIPLKQILSSEYFDDADNVDNAINVLQNTVAYDLPMLLKPLYDVRGIEPTFITFLESGAYMPITRKLIEIGIPRETAIYLYDSYFSNSKIEGESAYDTITNVIKNSISQMPYWIQVQLSSFV